VVARDTTGVAANAIAAIIRFAKRFPRLRFRCITSPVFNANGPRQQIGLRRSDLRIDMRPSPLPDDYLTFSSVQIVFSGEPEHNKILKSIPS
jgi:hypothetical protein